MSEPGTNQLRTMDSGKALTQQMHLVSGSKSSSLSAAMAQAAPHDGLHWNTIHRLLEIARGVPKAKIARLSFLKTSLSRSTLLLEVRDFPDHTRTSANDSVLYAM
jgi:hypothetical protein